ncbi:MAG: alanine racemase [Gammaproteobacteria bacterium]|nr:alanine racemase [Gammaproteobacteria bacterium]
MSVGSMKDQWRARALIDPSALRHNASIVRSLAPDSRLLAVVKADAYGHGMATVVNALNPVVDGFAVATIEEGVSLRQVNDSRPVVVLSGLWDRGQLDVFGSQGLDPVVHSRYQVEWVKRYRGRPIDVWLKFDSGMNRLGMDRDAFRETCRVLSGSPSVSSVRLMSHLANADDPRDDFTASQIRRFARASKELPNERSLANSAGIMCWPDSHFDWVRPGLMLYGASPLEREKTTCSLLPAMEFQARVIAIRDVRKGDSIGYGRTYRASDAMRIAVVSAGYGDGYFRVVSGHSYVVIRKRKAPIVGRISMDSMTVDIGDIEDVRIGDVAVLWGASPAIHEVARWAGTVSYEVLCRITPRVLRVAREAETDV